MSEEQGFDYFGQEDTYSDRMQIEEDDQGFLEQEFELKMDWSEDFEDRREDREIDDLRKEREDEPLGSFNSKLLKIGDKGESTTDYLSSHGVSTLRSDTLSTVSSQVSVIKIHSKRIKKKSKKYKPFKEGDKVYIYEDNPVLYMKIRKRIQNRSSARRVRSKEKLHLVSYKKRIKVLETDLGHCKSNNLKLKTENSMLKNQISFLEKLLLQQNGNNPRGLERPTPSTTISSNNDDYLNMNSGGLQRVEPRARINKNLKVMGLMGIVLAVSIISEGAADPKGPIGPRVLQECKLMFSGLTLFIFNHNFWEQLTIMSSLRIVFLFVILFIFGNILFIFKQTWGKSKEDRDISNSFLLMNDHMKTIKFE